jgi:hypothetical protein
MRFGSVDIPAIFADGRTIVELKTATGAFDPFAKSSRHDRYLRFAVAHGVGRDVHFSPSLTKYADLGLTRRFIRTALPPPPPAPHSHTQ